MIHPEMTRALAAERQRDLARAADRWRRTHPRRDGDPGAHRWYRLWLRLTTRERATRVPAPVASAPARLPLPRPARDRIIDLTSSDGPVVLVGEGPIRRYTPLVGWNGWSDASVAGADRSPYGSASTVHAVSDTGYPLCGAARVTHVMLSQRWEATWPGACAACAAAFTVVTTELTRPPFHH